METIETLFTQILKRDGSTAEFDFDRIVEAIYKAAQAVGGNDRDLSIQLTQQVIERLQANRHQGKSPSVEEIQDAIEKTLIESGHAKTAKAFILYREKRKEVRDVKSSFLAIEKTVDQYLQNSSENGLNPRMSFRGLTKHISDILLTNYALNKIYPPEISEAHRDGIIHIHDLGSAISGSSLLYTVEKSKNPEEALMSLKRMLDISSEWNAHVVLENFEAILEHFNNGFSFFGSNSSNFFISIQKPEIVSALIKEIMGGKSLPGLIVKGNYLKQFPLKNPMVLSPSQNDHAHMLGIIPLKQMGKYPSQVLGAVSINLKRISKETSSRKDFQNHLEKSLQKAVQALILKKKIFEQNLKSGLFPLTSRRGLGNDSFLSIAPVGLFEVASLMDETNDPLTTLKNAQEILDFIRKKLESVQELTLAMDFLSGRNSPYHEWEQENIHVLASQFLDLMPFMTFRTKTSQIIQELDAQGKNFQAWIFS